MAEKSPGRLETPSSTRLTAIFAEDHTEAMIPISP